MRRAAQALWFLVGIGELMLLLRIASVLIWGINQDLSPPSSAPGFVYAVTAFPVNNLSQAANFLVPYQGLRHGLDISALMAMVILFFGCLALTKVALWATEKVAPSSRR